MLMDNMKMDSDKLEAEIISIKSKYSVAIGLLCQCYSFVNKDIKEGIEISIDNWCDSSNQRWVYVKSVNNIHLIPKKNKPVL